MNVSFFQLHSSKKNSLHALVSVLGCLILIFSLNSETFSEDPSQEEYNREDWLTRHPPDEGLNSHRVMPLHSMDTLRVPWASESFSPTINGVIGLNEWVFAETLDISNTADTVDTVPPGSVLLYAVHDSFHLYIGVINYGDSTFSSFNDHLMFFIDTDHDGMWDTLTEGWWRFWTVGGLVDSSIWSPCCPIGVYQLANNVDFAMTNSGGPMQWEVGWNLVTSPLSANIEDTLGLAVRVHGSSIQPYSYGRWPLDAVVGGSGDPTTFGDFLLVLESVGVEENTPHFTLRTPQLMTFPNPFHTSTQIKYIVPSINPESSIPNRVSLNVYDLTGRLVETLVNEPKNPGKYQIQVTSDQIPGSGIYLYRLEFGKVSLTRKLIHLR
jgi:hypothetical protein